MRVFILGEFQSAHASLEAIRQLKQKGYRGLDLHSPFPVEGSEELLELPPSKLPAAILAGGLFGASFGYAMQWFCSAVDFPLVIGGRPPHSPPAFVPITFELGILFATFAAFFGVWLATHLPRLHHPLFEAPGFESATIDAFWVTIEGAPEALDQSRAEHDLSELGARRVEIVRGEP
ncbi:MAG: DUF3341 domain-containing protein [Deltaproteobacteria bacterium]